MNDSKPTARMVVLRKCVVNEHVSSNHDNITQNVHILGVISVPPVKSCKYHVRNRKRVSNTKKELDDMLVIVDNV